MDADRWADGQPGTPANDFLPSGSQSSMLYPRASPLFRGRPLYGGSAWFSAVMFNFAPNYTHSLVVHHNILHHGRTQVRTPSGNHKVCPSVPHNNSKCQDIQIRHITSKNASRSLLLYTQISSLWDVNTYTNFKNINASVRAKISIKLPAADRIKYTSQSSLSNRLF
jgi:hypothetical protein